MTLPDPYQAESIWIVDDGGCGLHAVAARFGSSTSGILAPTLLLSTSGSGADVITAVVAPYETENDGIGTEIRGATNASILVVGPDGRSLQLLADNGGSYSVLWSLPPTVVHSASGGMSLGWVVVTNNSGKDVIVDPATGQEAAGLDAASMVLIKDKAATVTQADAGNLVIETTPGLVHLSTAAICR